MGQDWVVRYHNRVVAGGAAERPRAGAQHGDRCANGKTAGWRWSIAASPMRWTDITGPPFVAVGARDTADALAASGGAAAAAPRAPIIRGARRVDQFRTHKTLWQAMER